MAEITRFLVIVVSLSSFCLGHSLFVTRQISRLGGTCNVLGACTGGDTPEGALFGDKKILSKILQVAIAASKKAGDIIVSNADGAKVVEKKSSSRDLLTLIDPLCEKVSSTAASTRRMIFPSGVDKSSIVSIAFTGNCCNSISSNAGDPRYCGC